MTVSVRLHHQLEALTLALDFEAPAGVTALFGRSGAGKTTVVNAVAGLMRPREGRIVVNGRVLCDTGVGLCLPPHRRRVGYIFQDARLFPHLTVRQNLTYGRWFARGRAAVVSEARVIEMLGLGALLARRPGALSGGERQRVAIGRALLAAPEVILADEPLAALDAARKAEILPYFERLRDEVAVPILYVSHSAAEVARLATTVVAIEKGRVLRQGPAEDVLSDPRVLPVGTREAGAVLSTQVAAHHDDGLSELDAGGVRLLLPRVDAPVGAALRVRIKAQDVMLARVQPEGLSALNVFPATVSEIRMGEGPGALVQLETAGGAVLARVTRRSVAALALHQGAPVFAVLKAVSVAKESVG